MTFRLALVDSAVGRLGGMRLVFDIRTVTNAVRFRRCGVHREWCVNNDHDRLRTQSDQRLSRRQRDVDQQRRHDTHVRGERRRLEFRLDRAWRTIQHDLSVRRHFSVPLLTSSWHGRDSHRSMSRGRELGSRDGLSAPA